MCSSTLFQRYLAVRQNADNPNHDFDFNSYSSVVSLKDKFLYNIQ